jgi:hypothetical protein
MQFLRGGNGRKLSQATELKSWIDLAWNIFHCHEHISKFNVPRNTGITSDMFSRRHFTETVVLDRFWHL